MRLVAMGAVLECCILHSTRSTDASSILSVAMQVLDSVEFVGVYTLDASNPAQRATDEEGSGFHPPAAEIRAHCPPASLVPRLHAISHHVRTHNNPALPLAMTQEGICVHKSMPRKMQYDSSAMPVDPGVWR